MSCVGDGDEDGEVFGDVIGNFCGGGGGVMGYMVGEAMQRCVCERCEGECAGE